MRVCHPNPLDGSLFCQNTSRVMNMKTTKEKTFARKTASLLRTLGQPTRLRILLALQRGEACVCHLEAILGMRQAYISQHLMALRDAGLVTTRRDGRFIFYRLRDPELVEVIVRAGNIAGVSLPQSPPALQADACDCPSCSTHPAEGIPIMGGFRA